MRCRGTLRDYLCPLRKQGDSYGDLILRDEHDIVDELSDDYPIQITDALHRNSICERHHCLFRGDLRNRITSGFMEPPVRMWA
jgi:hypothetical protein